MRRLANSDQTFWAKPADAGGWMEDLASPHDDADDASTLEGLTAGRHEPTERMFHELRDLTSAPPVPASEPGTDPPDDPDDALPPAAFTISTVSDDLLPSWDLDLG